MLNSCQEPGQLHRPTREHDSGRTSEIYERGRWGDAGAMPGVGRDWGNAGAMLHRSWKFQKAPTLALHWFGEACVRLVRVQEAEDMDELQLEKQRKFHDEEQLRYKHIHSINLLHGSSASVMLL